MNQLLSEIVRLMEIILFFGPLEGPGPKAQPAYAKVRNDPFPGPGAGGIGL